MLSLPQEHKSPESLSACSQVKHSDESPVAIAPLAHTRWREAMMRKEIVGLLILAVVSLSATRSPRNCR